MEKITFISTVFNDVSGVRMLLDSLLKQTKLPDEVIIVDAMSSDGTYEELREYEKVFKKKGVNCVLIQEKCNRAKGRNIAIKNASGAIIIASDAGCELSPEWLFEMTKPFNDQSTEVVSGYYSAGKGTIFQASIAAYTCVMPDKLKEDFLPSSRSIAFRKEIWKKVGGYPEHLDTCEDLVFARELQNIQATRVLVRQPLVTWPQEKSLSSFATQIFGYARGDGQALYIRQQTPLLFGRYVVALALFLYGFYSPALWVLLGSAVFAYLIWAVKKNYRYAQHPKAYMILPILQIVSDFCVMCGMVYGMISKLRQSLYGKNH
jgi:glycosyltransferase involved in cell wall biosynthesis